MGKLEGRAIVVTGGGKGIGAAYSLAAATEGARVCVADVISTDATVNAIKGSGGQAFGLQCDVSNRREVEKMFRETAASFGAVHGLVNNAALFAELPVGPMEELSSDLFDRVLAINIRGSFECIRAALPYMRERKYGKIVNVCSGVVWLGSPMMAAYTASKGGVLALTRSSARELGSDGIRVNAIAPGLTESEGVKEHPWQLQFRDKAVANQSIARLEQPSDLTGTVNFLLSEDSDFMTGQTLVVDGGGIMH